MRVNNFKKILLICFLLFSFNTIGIAQNENVLNNAPYDVCFTPGGNCTQLIVNKINAATESIFVQAYSFTSAPIAKALVNASKRRVVVNVILDKTQIKNNQYSSAKFLIGQGITTYIDYKPAIAHNKMIIIDGQTVITGSFNFTKAAQLHNAENLLVIKDQELAKKYLANWYDRREKSILADEYYSKPQSRRKAHKQYYFG